MHRKAIALTVLVMALFTAAPSMAATPQVSLVNVFVGTAKDRGSTFPGATLPHGMIQMSPVTPTATGGGYVYGDATITGFALTRLSGIPCSNLGDAPILPLASPDKPQAVPFSHADEQASPGYYRVRFGNGVTAEMTATLRTGTFRFTFPAGHGYTRASGTAASDRTLEGASGGPGLCGGPTRTTVHYVYAFDQPFTRLGNLLAFSTGTVTVRAAVSYVSVAGAWRNLQAENPTADFATTRARARAAWAAKLALIRVAGGRDVDRRKFYTALYHSLLAPNVISDVGQPTRYTNISGWDIYRTQFPLLCLIEPTVARDVVLSMLDAYDRTGQLGRWQFAGVEQGVMVGDPVDAMIAEAIALKVPGIPVRRALAAMVKGATVPQPGPFFYPSMNAAGNVVQRPGLTEYLRYGYVPHDHGQGFIWGSASTSLEYMIGDFAISRVAAAAGERKLAAAFLARSRNWRQLVNPASGFIEPRNRDGSFLPLPSAPLDQEWVAGYTEGTGWQYTWMVPHDLAGLVKAMGGRKVASERLDRFFTQVTGGGYGPYLAMSNEPSFAAPWMYLWTGEPKKTLRVVRRVQDVFTLAPDGLPGDDDLGATSAWFVWSALGMYPVTPGVREVACIAPLFKSVTVAGTRPPCRRFR